MIPPLSSNTVSGEDILGTKNQSNSNKTQKISDNSNTGGRPEKPDD